MSSGTPQMNFCNPRFCTVTVEEGVLKGKSEVDIDGVPFLSFMGIPYAKPPVGILRFKPPQPPEKWKGVRDATKEGKGCCQPPLLPKRLSCLLRCCLFKKIIEKHMGGEDCLVLNVFTRPLCSRCGLRPVMVFIHGGAFVIGSSKRILYGPEYLMTEDIVLVTLNYRLGVLGFLVIDDPSLGVTGNAGLKDQLQALKWIQKNIKYFGGDPNNVTIFGQSAGAASVHFLVLSPLAKNLFHRAIMQSGTALCPWTRGINCASEFAQNLGCCETTNKKILEFLQNVSCTELAFNQLKYTGILSGSTKCPIGPTIESKVRNGFLKEEPLELMSSGSYNHVPLMFGYTNEEGLFAALGEEYGARPDFENFVPYFVNNDKNSKHCQKMNKEIKLFYFGTENPDLKKKEIFCDIFTDTMFLIGIHSSIKAHVKSGTRPVYCYRCSLDTNLNIFRKFLRKKIKGTSHGDDLGYLFKVRRSSFKQGSIEEISIRRMVKMWSNFARTGNPVPSKTSLLDVEWKPVSKDTLHFLDIGYALVPGVDPDGDRMKFWEGITKGIIPSY